MKQKMMIKVTMPSWKKTRLSKAMELAARTEGMSSTAITGDDRDRLEVVGEGVDLVNLVTCLRKKVGPAEVLQVEEIKEKKEKPEELEKKKEPEEGVTAQPLIQWHPGCCHCSYPPPPMVVFYDEPVNCAIV